MALPRIIHVNDPIPLRVAPPATSGDDASAPGTSVRVIALRRAALDRALAPLTPAQRRVLRLLLTCAPVGIVARIAREGRAVIEEWLGPGEVYGKLIEAAQNGLAPTDQAELFSLIVVELAESDGEVLDARARSTLAFIRAIGRLDAHTNCLADCSLRANRWDTTPP